MTRNRNAIQQLFRVDMDRTASQPRLRVRDGLPW